MKDPSLMCGKLLALNLVLNTLRIRTGVEGLTKAIKELTDAKTIRQSKKVLLTKFTLHSVLPEFVC